MVKTFNTCADLNIKYQKTLLGCANKFRTSITVGHGQVMMRVSIARTNDFVAPDYNATYEWAIILERSGEVIETVKLKGLVNHKTVGVENILANDEDHYEAYITLIKTSDGSVYPTQGGVIQNELGKLHPIAIIFEVV